MDPVLPLIDRITNPTVGISKNLKTTILIFHRQDRKESKKNDRSPALTVQPCGSSTMALAVGLCVVSWQLTASLACLAPLMLLNTSIDFG